MKKVAIDKKYAVGDDGNVYSDGLPLVKVAGCVGIHGERKRVSYLVARAFIPNTESRPYVIHKNGEPYDDRVENLEWSDEKDALPRRGRRPGLKSICAWDENGVTVGIWDNPSAAARALGLTANCVRAAADRCGSTGGYEWRWI